MPERLIATESDFRQLLAVVDPADHDGPGDLIPDTVLRGLVDLVGCDAVSFQLMDPARRWVIGQGYDTTTDATQEDPPELLDLFWSGFWASPACSYPQRSGDFSTTTRLSDFASRRALAGSSIGAYFAEVGIRHELMVPLPPDGAIDRRLLLFRTQGPDFTERDVLLMTLLRPHLTALHLRQRQRARGGRHLTPRQRQILDLVATGRTNVQIARALHVSEATVRKHLEHTFERLDVSSRTAAVMKAGSLAEPPDAASELA